MLYSIWQDLRFGCWQLYKKPKLALVVILCLALGMGPNATIFSLINAILLHPVDVNRPDRLVHVQSLNLGEDDRDPSSLNYPEYEVLNRDSESLSGLLVTSTAQVSALIDSDAELVVAETVSSNFFEVLGRQPLVGDVFRQEAEEIPGDKAEVVLGYGFWAKRFGENPAVIGSELLINGFPFKVLGVMPPTFTGARPGFQPDFWVPLMMVNQIRPTSHGRMTERDHNWLTGFGRLKDGITLDEAGRDLARIAKRLEDEYPEFHTRRTYVVSPFSNTAGMPKDMLQTMVTVLFAVVSLVLLVACSSVAALLLARSTERRQEIAMRLALGATRGRLIRQLMTESLLISFIAGVLALLMTFWAMDLLLGLIPELPGELMLNPRLDNRVLLFTGAISFIAAFLFGLAPAIQTSKPDLLPALKDQPVSMVSDRRVSRMRNGFVVAQYGLSVLLLIVAGLFLKGLGKVANIEPGFETENMMVYSVTPGLYGMDREGAGYFVNDLTAALEAQPEVSSVAYARTAPLSFGRNTFVLSPLTEDLASGEPVRPLDYNFVGPGYFQTMGIPVVRGRTFDEKDRGYLAPVGIVNQTLAERVWPGEDPLGKLVTVPGVSDAVEIIGVVADIKYLSLGEDPRPYFYLPVGRSLRYSLVFQIRTTGVPDPESIRKTIKQHYPEQALAGLRPMEEIVDLAMKPSRIAAILFGTFGLLALLLAVIGVYGVVSYSVNLRQQEIGIRMALGGLPRDLVWLLLRGGLILVAVGTFLGVVGAWGGTRFLGSMLIGVSPTDWAVYLFVPLLLGLVALTTIYLPARRITKTNPMRVLRYE